MLPHENVASSDAGPMPGPRNTGASSAAFPAMSRRAGGAGKRQAKFEAFLSALPDDRAILSSEIADTAELIGSRREAEAIGMLLAERGTVGMISGNAFYRLGIRNVRHPVLEARTGRRA